MRKVIIGAVAASLIGGSIAGMAFAKGPEEGPGPRFAQALNLTPEQQAKMQELWKSQHQERMNMRDSRRQEMNQMRTLDPKADNFQTEVDKLMKQAQQRAAERVKAQADMKSKMAEILTPEQMNKMQAMIAKRMERHDHYRSGDAQGPRDGHWKDGHHRDRDGRGGDNCRG